MIKYTIINDNQIAQAALVDSISSIPDQYKLVTEMQIQQVPETVEVDGHQETVFADKEVPVQVSELDVDYYTEVIDYSDGSIKLLSYAELQAAKGA